MARQEGQQIDTLPVQMYGWDGSPVRLGVEQFNPGFAIPEYDEIVLSYTDGDLTGVVYKLETVVVCTLTLSYTNGNLTGVAKS